MAKPKIKQVRVSTREMQTPVEAKAKLKKAVVGKKKPMMSESGVTYC